MKVFIVGASGLVGGNIFTYFKKQGIDVVGSHLSFPTSETVFFDPKKQDSNFDIIKYAPNYIIHCGALTNVDACEESPENSYLQTIISTKNLLKIAQLCGSRFIYISTDYVFDGKSGPYQESDVPNPINVYGKHKFDAETLVINDSPKHLIVRITNVYGNELRNKNFVSRLVFLCLNKQEKELSLPFDQFATPINALDVARAIYLLVHFQKVGIYHLASTDYMNRCQLAERVLRFFKPHNISINRITTPFLNQPANRPLLGGLISKKFISEFPDFQFNSVDDYLNDLITNGIKEY